MKKGLTLFTLSSSYLPGSREIKAFLFVCLFFEETSQERKTACVLTSRELLRGQQICPSPFPQKRSLLAAPLPDGSSPWVDTVAYKRVPSAVGDDGTPAPAEERPLRCLTRPETSPAVRSHLWGLKPLRRAYRPRRGTHQPLPSATAWSPRETALRCR